MKVKIIVGSTRQGRSTDKAAKWVAGQLKDQADIEVLDLRDYELPFFDEAISPQFNPERKPEGVVKEWLDKLAEADAVVIVTPEYNRSIPAVLKNAIDYVAYELNLKPVGLVAHGSSNGEAAVSHLRGIISGALGVTAPTAVYIPGMAGMLFDENGILNEDVANNPYGPVGSLDKQFEQLQALASK